MFAVWQKWLEGRDRSARTVAAYGGDMRQFREWFETRNGEAWAPARVTSLDVREWRRERLERSSPATVNRKLAALRSFFEWAAGEGLVVENPLAEVRQVEVQQGAPRWLDRAEQRRVIRALEIAVQGAQTERGRWRALRDRAMVGLMLYAGLRVAEVAGARLRDVELRPRSGTITVEGKRGKWRQVPLNASARRVLEEWLAVQPPGGEFVFGSQKGGGMDAASVWRRVDRIGARAGVEGLTPHRLRHSCAKGLVDANAPLNYVAEMLGHSSLQTTAIYARPGQADLARMVERAAWID